MTDTVVTEPVLALREKVDSVITDIKYHAGYIVKTGVTNNSVWFEVEHWRADTLTGIDGWGKGGKRWVNPAWSNSDIVRAVFGAIKAYDEHEVREAFLYRGQRVFGPHMDLDALVDHLVEQNRG